MGRTKAITSLVVDQPGQNARRLYVGRGESLCRVFCKLILDRVKGGSIDYGGMLAQIGDTLMGDIPDVNPIREQLVQVASVKWPSACFPIARISASLGDQPETVCS